MFSDYYKNKKVLVLGHTGFKGAWLTQWLLHLGADVIGVSDYVPSQPSLYEVLNLKSQITDYQCDIRDLDPLLRICHLEMPEIIFHLAAQPIVRSSYEDPKQTFDTNLGGTVNVLEVIKQIESVKTAIMITSDKCYENVEWEYGYRENDRLGGKDPYSASKACAEIAIRSYYESFFKETGKQIASVRAGNVIGGGDWAAHRIVPDCMKAWSQKEKVVMRAANATRPWQHVLEPLSGYLWLAAKLAEPKFAHLNGSAFNFGPDATVNFTVKKLIEDLAIYWQDVQYEDHSNHSVMHEAGLLKLCCDKALHYLNWQPTLTFDQTIEMTSEWYRSYYSGSDMVTYTQQQLNSYMQFAKERGQLWTLSKIALSVASA